MIYKHMMKVIVKKLTIQEVEDKGIAQWPIWTKEVSRFPYTYEEDEECLFLEGEVKVETEAGTVSISPGDYVFFPCGLECIWDIRKPVKKHYKFS